MGLARPWSVLLPQYWVALLARHNIRQGLTPARPAIVTPSCVHGPQSSWRTAVMPAAHHASMGGHAGTVRAGSAGAAGAGQSQPTEGHADQPHYHGYDAPA
jgi:hypothetical protein